MPRVAVVFHSIEGQTERVARRIAELLNARGARADVFPVSAAPASLWTYDTVVVGGSVHLGRHHRDLAAFIVRHSPELHARPTAFFSVSLTAAQADDDSQDLIHDIVGQFLDDAGWEPDSVAYFGGALAYTRYNAIKRFIMKRIAARMGQPTDTSRDFEFTDWDAVDRFADDVLAGVAVVARA